jgi:PKD repeat protein
LSNPANYELRIYLHPSFVDPNTEVLIWQSSLNGNGITSNYFTPLNDDKDGFCIFKIYYNNAPLPETFNKYVVKEKIQTGAIGSGADYMIHYASRFFYWQPGGMGSVASYLTNLGQKFTNTWNTQINDWNLCSDISGNKPINIRADGYYYICVNHGIRAQDIDFWGDHVSSSPCSSYWQVNIKVYRDYELYNYDNENDLLTSTIPHEFFHTIQFSHNPNFPHNDNKMQWLIEGQARFIQTVACEELEYNSSKDRLYRTDANNFLNPNVSTSLYYQGYKYCLFWRFLYEKYNSGGSIADKLNIIKETQSGYSNTDIPAIKTFMDNKLNSSSCPDFDSALKVFSKCAYFNNTVYGLWNKGDDNFYVVPFISELINYNGVIVSRANRISSSFGIDYWDINFQTGGQVYLKFNGNINNNGVHPTYYVNFVYDNSSAQLDDHIITLTEGTGEILLDIPSANQKGVLIVTRLDDEEGTIPFIETDYQVVLSPLSSPNTIAADFTGAPTNVPIGSSVFFTDASIPGNNSTITQWQWEFDGGTPATSNEQNPTVTYNTSGVYNASLTITNSNNETSTKTRSAYIIVYESSPGNDLFLTCFAPWSGNSGESLFFTASVMDGEPPYSFIFTFGDGYDFQIENIYNTFVSCNHTYSANGIKHFSCSVFDANNKTDYYEQDIIIGTAGTHNVDFDWDFEYGNAGINQDVSFTNLTEGGMLPYIKYFWEWGNELNTNTAPVSSTGIPWEIITQSYANPHPTGNPQTTIQYPVYGTYPFTLTVTDNEGFDVTKTKYIYVSGDVDCFALRTFNVYPGIYIYNFNYGEESLKKIRKGDEVLFSGARDPLNYNENTCVYWPAPSYHEIQCYLKDVTNVRWNVLNTNKSYNNYYEGIQSEACAWYSDRGGHYWYNSGSFNNEGKYTVQLEVWNRYWGDDPDMLYYDARYGTPSALNPSIRGDLRWYDADWETFSVIDCEKRVHVVENIPSGPHEDVYAGYFDFAGTVNVNVEPDAKIKYEACNEIDLLPGFTSEIGTDFTARIDPIIVSDKSSANYTFPLFSNDELNEHLGKSMLQVLPNPANSFINIKNENSNVNIENISVYDVLGNLIFKIDNQHTNAYTLQISNWQNGIYILQILLSDKKVVQQKMVKCSQSVF